jgi:hypothetical protein
MWRRCGASLVAGADSSGWPQPPQNLIPVGFSKLQLLHFMVFASAPNR